MMMWLPPYRVELLLYGEEPDDFMAVAGDDLLVSESHIRYGKTPTCEECRCEGIYPRGYRAS
jgi:hypothetical protein